MIGNLLTFNIEVTFTFDLVIQNQQGSSTSHDQATGEI